MSFFRRLSFSPDGSLLVAPTGIWRPDLPGSTLTTNKQSEPESAVYIYARSALRRGPVAVLAGLKKPATVVRFCPLLFQKRALVVASDDGPTSISGLFDLPYRMVFAVGTHDSIFIYDTQHSEPLAQLSHMHYHHLTDLAWLTNESVGADGAEGEVKLMVSSSDGFCSVVCFDKGELGDGFVPTMTPASTATTAVGAEPKLDANGDVDMKNAVMMEVV